MKRMIARKGLRFCRCAELLIPTIVLVCAGYSSVSATEVYTWTDEHGITHFSDVPADTAQSQVIEVDTAPPPISPVADTLDASSADPLPVSDDSPASPVSLAQKRREQLAETRLERQRQQAELQKECAAQQTRLARFEPARRVYYTNDQGETIRLDDDERMAVIDEARGFIAKNCK